MIQVDHLPMAKVLDYPVIADVSAEHQTAFGIGDEGVFARAATLWAMISQFLFSEAGKSCKAAVGRVISLWCQLGGDRALPVTPRIHRRISGLSAEHRTGRRLGLSDATLRRIDLDDVWTADRLGICAVLRQDITLKETQRFIETRGHPCCRFSHCTYWLIAVCQTLGVSLVMKNQHKERGASVGIPNGATIGKGRTTPFVPGTFIRPQSEYC
jgi:hypothetical protein